MGAIESLEGRTLFADIAGVTADYSAVLADATLVKSTVASAVATYKLNAKTIAADIKALGKSKTNTVDIAALKKAEAVAVAADTKAAAKLVSVGKANLSHAKSAFVSDITHPTSANAIKLATALSKLTASVSPAEAALVTDVGTGDTNVEAALNVLVAANPTAPTLSADVTTAETAQSSSIDSVDAVVATTNIDLDALVAAVS